MEQFTNANSDFALKLFKQVSQDGKSSFLSPASITAALAMTYMGAEGSTKGQMNQLMFNGLNDQEINEGMQKVIKAVNDPVDGYMLNTANRIYVEKSYEVLQTFLDVVQKYHRSDCVSSDFKTNFESVRLEINKWVEDKTNQKIKDLLAKGILDPRTRLVLVNAIYFKGDWKNEFDERRTYKQPFHATNEKTVDVDMMHAFNNFQYTATEKCHVLGISYKSPDLAMFFVLPTQRNQLHELETELTGPALIQLFNQVHTEKVEVALPKFKLEDSFDLVKNFQKLGCIDMFSKEDADFSKINPEKHLFVSAIVHKAFIEVNEKGAEAAAAAAVKKFCRVYSDHADFIADHPFLFAIVERKTMSILFLGHYYG